MRTVPIRNVTVKSSRLAHQTKWGALAFRLLSSGQDASWNRGQIQLVRQAEASGLRGRVDALFRRQSYVNLILRRPHWGQSGRWF